MARRALEVFSFDITECHNGVEELEKINTELTFDLVLMDIMMPVMGGEEAMQKLKKKRFHNSGACFNYRCGRWSKRKISKFRFYGLFGKAF